MSVIALLVGGWVSLPALELKEEMAIPKTASTDQAGTLQGVQGEVNSWYAHRCDRGVSESHSTLQLVMSCRPPAWLSHCQLSSAD